MSGGWIPYNLRPNKAVDRHIFLDLLITIKKYKDISKFTYIGMAGPTFEDFKLVHSRLGNKKLISLEGSSAVHERQKFNIPFKCIECINTTTGEFIEDYVSEKNIIFWLDYADPSQLKDQILEFQSLLTKMTCYDVLKITLNCDHEELFIQDIDNPKPAEELPALRYKKLSSILGDYLPAETTKEKITGVDYPKVLFDTLVLASKKAFAGNKNLFFEPLSCFTYNDSHPMLTFTGLILDNESLEEFYKKTDLNKWEFYVDSTTEQIEAINLPELTIKEKLTIDQYLPSKDKKTISNKFSYLFKNSEFLESYIRFYRQYPTYSKILP